MKHLVKQVLHFLKSSSYKKVTSCTNSGRTRRNNHTRIALIYHDKIPQRNEADLGFIKHNHWGWKKCSTIFREENQVPKFLPTDRNVSSENTGDFRISSLKK